MYICPNCGKTGPLEKAASHLRRCCTDRVTGEKRRLHRECCGETFDDAGYIIHMSVHAQEERTQHG